MCVRTDGTNFQTTDCLEVSLKFERLKTKEVLINTIDTDKIQNPELPYGVVDFTTDYVHPQLHYQIDNGRAYFIAVFASMIPILLFAPTLGIPLLGAAFLALVIAIYTAALNVIGVDERFADLRGANHSVLSPYHKTYIENIRISNGLTNAIDQVFTNPTKLQSLKDAVFFHTVGLLHPTFVNVEWDRLNMSNETYLKWVNDRFGAKWRLIGNDLYVVHKETDYYTPVVDLRLEPFCIEPLESTPIAAKEYTLAVDSSDLHSNSCKNWYSDVISFTNNVPNPAQKGKDEMQYLDAGAEFRNSGRIDNIYTKIDNIYNGIIGIPGIGGVIAFITGNLASTLHVNDNDGIYIFTEKRTTETPKLIFVNPADTTLAVAKPYTAAEVNYAKRKGYVNVTSSDTNFNYYAPCDEVLNAITPNCYSLQNDDPRITQKEGLRQYKQVQLCCQTLKDLGLLDAPNSTPDIAIDFYALIRNFDGTETEGEITRIMFKFGSAKIELDVQRVLKY